MSLASFLAWLPERRVFGGISGSCLNVESCYRNPARHYPFDLYATTLAPVLQQVNLSLLEMLKSKYMARSTSAQMTHAKPCDYSPDSSGKCPHCGVVVKFVAPRIGYTSEAFNRDVRGIYVIDGSSGVALITTAECPQCKKIVFSLSRVAVSGSGRSRIESTEFEYLLYPPNRARQVPPEVPREIAEDYSEAAAVLDKSRKASAALSRRCLQAVLNSQGFNKQQLNGCIDEALPTLPEYIAENLDAVRTVGNFAAHSMKSNQSGSIVDVEPHEAEFLLDVLDDLFDHYYVKPAASKLKRDSINKKLASVGKPPLKTK